MVELLQNGSAFIKLKFKGIVLKNAHLFSNVFIVDGWLEDSCNWSAASSGSDDDDLEVYQQSSSRTNIDPAYPMDQVQTEITTTTEAGDVYELV